MKLNLDIDAYVAANGLHALIGAHDEGTENTLDPSRKFGDAPYSPKWNDLARLHHIACERKVSSVLEFGCGYSTIVLAEALYQNRRRHGEYISKNFRRSNAFEHHVVDDMEKYLALTREKVPSHLADIVHFHASPVQMTTFNGRVATEYETLPNLAPDLIYLDGPSRYSVLGDVNGITTAHASGLPMACDLLKIEHFLTPGMMIVVDGRTANARFLKSNFQRRWAYETIDDIHLFELQEAPLGDLNRRQIEFCLGEFWLAPPDGEPA